jgi:hypothetical protein
MEFILATCPSRPSKITERIIAQQAKVKWLSSEKMIEIKPQARLKPVRKFAK